MSDCVSPGKLPAFKIAAMTIQQLIIAEITNQPEPLLREVWNYVKFLKSTAGTENPGPQSSVRKGYGSVPGIVIADDFDAPLEEFTDYR